MKGGMLGGRIIFRKFWRCRESDAAGWDPGTITSGESGRHWDLLLKRSATDT